MLDIQILCNVLFYLETRIKIKHVNWIPSNPDGNLIRFSDYINGKTEIKK